MRIKNFVLGVLIISILSISTLAYAANTSEKSSINMNYIASADGKKIEFGYGGEIDISILKKPEIIEEIILSSNPHIKNLKAFKKLRNLKKINFESYTSFGNYDYGIFPKGILTVLPNLKELRIADALKIENPNEFSSLKKLESLTLSYVNLKDYSPIFSMKTLKKLEIHTPEKVSIYKNLKEIKNLQKLEELTLYDRGLKGKSIPKDIFNGLTALKKLDIAYIKAEKLGYLGNLKNLESLKLSDMELKGYADIFNLEKLKNLELDLESSNLTLTKSLDKIGNLRNLETLYLDVGKMESKDIESIKQLLNLKCLILQRSTDYTNNLVLSKGILKELTNLRKLELSSIDVEDFTELTYLESLESLNVHGLKDYSVLSKMKNLKTIQVYSSGYKGTPTNLEVLKSFKKLEELSLYDNSFTKDDLKLIKGIPILTKNPLPW